MAGKWGWDFPGVVCLVQVAVDRAMVQPTVYPIDESIREGHKGETAQNYPKPACVKSNKDL